MVCPKYLNEAQCLSSVPLHCYCKMPLICHCCCSGAEVCPKYLNEIPLIHHCHCSGKTVVIYVLWNNQYQTISNEFINRIVFTIKCGNYLDLTPHCSPYIYMDNI